jgi:hypothetical protein
MRESTSQTPYSESGLGADLVVLWIPNDQPIIHRGCQSPIGQGLHICAATGTDAAAQNRHGRLAWPLGVEHEDPETTCYGDPALANRAQWPSTGSIRPKRDRSDHLGGVR